MIIKYISIIKKYYVNSLIVLSAPQLNTQGSVGWNVTPKIPKSEQSSCSLSNFNGTTKGFCSKSLKKKKKTINMIKINTK